MSAPKKFGTLRPENTGCRVQVCCRFRPLNKKEKGVKAEISNPSPMNFVDEGSLKIFNPHRIDTQKDKDAIKKVLAKAKQARYNFDRAFPPEADQKEVYNYVGKPMIKELMAGYNCTIFAYGQTSCLDPDQEVLMYDGTTKKAKNVVLGDQLMGDDSTPRNVLELFSGEDEMYEIVPKKGDSYIVNQNHLLTLRYSPHSFVQWCDSMSRYKVHYCENGRYRCKTFMVHGENPPKRGNSVNKTREEAKKRAYEFLANLKEEDKLIDIPVREYLKKSKTWKRLHKGVRTGVDFTKKDVKIDPYLLGLWLGDGSKSSTNITNVDQEVVEYVKSMTESLGCRFVHKDNNLRISAYSPFSPYKRENSNPFHTFLKTSDLYNNKHIPRNYLINSREVRLAILAGLLDSDGYYDKRKNSFEITQKRENLLDDIIFLSRSLGFSSYKKKVSKSCVYKGERKTGVYYRCFISGENLGDIPTLIPRKRAKNSSCFKSTTSVGITVRSIGRGKFNGFMLDGNHRFLLNSFDITHNSGKSHSMFGFDVESGETGVWKEEKGMGIIPRAINDIFRHIEESTDDIEYTIQVSFLEIYLEKVRDLLSPKHVNMKIRETKDHDIYVEGLKEIYVGSFEEILALIRKGQKYRAVAETKMNQYSSRSHSLLQMKITQNNLTKHTKTKSKLIMIDLAGSERVGKSGAQGLTLVQVQHINKSLLMLGNVIHAITEKDPHIPYRDSKLTRLLQDSLGGNSKTCLLITCSPSWNNLSETVSTLNFGARAKRIENKPRVNKELTMADYRRMMDQANRKINEQAERIKVLEAEIAELLVKVKDGGDGEVKLEVDTDLIEQLRSKVNELDNLLLESKNTENELKDQIQQQRDDLELKVDEISRMAMQLAESEIEVQKKDQNILKINEQMNQALMEKKKKELELFEQNLQIDELKNERSKLEDENKELQETLEELKHRVEDLETEDDPEPSELPSANEVSQPITIIQEVESPFVTPQLPTRSVAQPHHAIIQELEEPSDSLAVVISGEDERKVKEKVREECRQECRQEFAEKVRKVQADTKETIGKYEKKFEVLRTRYNDFSKQYEKLKDNLKIKMEENMGLQTEKEQLELKLQERQLEHKESLEELLTEKARETKKDEEIVRLKKQLKRKSDEAMRVKIDAEDTQQQYEQALEEHKHLERQIRRLRLKNVKLLKKLGHRVSEKPISDGDLSEASSMEPRVERQFNALRKNLKKMREYNLYIRGRERYYLTMIENRRQHIEALEESLKEASRILLMREQEHMTTIGALRDDVSRYCAILKELGVPEDILGSAGRRKVVVPLRSGGARS